MSIFLYQEELEQLTGYKANQRKRICLWLKNQGINFTINRLGDPVVMRAQFDAPAQQEEPNWKAIGQ